MIPTITENLDEQSQTSIAFYQSTRSRAVVPSAGRQTPRGRKYSVNTLAFVQSGGPDKIIRICYDYVSRKWPAVLPNKFILDDCKFESGRRCISLREWLDDTFGKVTPAIEKTNDVRDHAQG
jgi:hypothetical protein